MKRKSVFLLVFCLVLVMGLVGIRIARPVAQVAVQSGEQVQYLWVLDNHRVLESEPFTWDSECLTAGPGVFAHQIADGEIQTFLRRAKLLDTQGKEVEVSETAAALLKAAAAEIDHDMLAFSIFQDNGRYFAWAQLNVNWQSPGVLYEFHPETGVLEKLYQWDDTDLLGIAA